MKKYVWSETVVEGGKPFTGTLTHPPSNTGAFQNIGIRDSLGAPEGATKAPEFYADAAVVAYRRPAIDVVHRSIARQDHVQRRLTECCHALGWRFGTNHQDPDSRASARSPGSNMSSLPHRRFAQLRLSRRIRTGSWHWLLESLLRKRTLEASDDGQNFRPVASLTGGDAPEHTISFPAVTAKYFRVTFKRTPPPPIPDWAAGIDPASLGMKVPPTPTDYEVAEMALHAGARVNHFEEKAAFVPEVDLYGFATPPVATNEAIAKSDVIDLTSKMSADGKLGLDTSSGRLGCSTLWVFPSWHHKPPCHCRSDRPRSRQDGPSLREELLRQVSGQLQGNGGP